jgi:hypothetical protein
MSLSTPPSRSIDELDDAIFQLSCQINSAGYRLLVLVREFDDRFGWAKWSFANCAEWLAWRCGLSLSAAREKLRAAHALRGLPEISAAYARGRLSYSKVRALTRVARRENEDLLLAYALDATAAQVEERCRQMRNVSPDSVDTARRAWERRRPTIARNEAAGTMTVTLEVPIDDGELLAKAVDRAVETGDADLGPEFAATGWQAQQADAMVAVARSYLKGGPTAASSSADHYQVVVHVDESALRGGIGRADLPLETVRRLSCDGSIVPIGDNSAGQPIAVGRKTRTVSPPLKRALMARDRGCSFPGCGRRHYLDAHHIHHWADGGDTSLENLTMLCTRHHRLLHEGAFAIRRNADGTIRFERSDGRVIPAGGYRREDYVDDFVDDLGVVGLGDIAEPSAEVCEPRCVGYRTARTSTRRIPTSRWARGRETISASSDR